ncbi:phage recombination protein Bet [Pyxidicoccus parkwayensis]|uniref:Phage recombination protein Bet n=1 Tax=Pyxidicoccus parkwayensis TaxID=2813578 RepID=A0ABX7P358_9BACT|nr:phage recombination protein Bet [Pyxidicoccus parkwaysis]QSQ24886.1 phage recombination protein Bet [Pyxidicoccus parkwaysis]
MADGNVPHNGWTPERAELVRRTICPKGISEDEFLLFMEQCRRSGLDPLLKEAFCVARRLNVGNRERPQWVTKHEFQPSEAGMLARAERFPDFRGLQASAVFAEDEISLDQGKGEVVHRFNPAKRKGALVGAWARVVRDGKLPVVVWLDFSGYVQTTPLWAKIPTTMIEKCARVAALRKAYPEAFGGLYVREELPADEQPTEDVQQEVVSAAPSQTASRAAPPPALPATTATREALEVAATGMQRQQQPAPAEVRVEQQPETAAQPAPSAPPMPRNSATVVAFGPCKGMLAAELSDVELGDSIALANEKLTAEPKARWARAMRENLAMLEAEAEFRAALPPLQDSREPGSDG